MGSDYISLLSTITDYSKCNDKDSSLFMQV